MGDGERESEIEIERVRRELEREVERMIKRDNNNNTCSSMSDPRLLSAHQNPRYLKYTEDHYQTETLPT